MSTSTMSRSARIRSRILSPLLAAGLLAATGSALAPAAASAAPSASPAAASALAPTLITASVGLRATRIAAAQRGDPYRWGASGPSAFDCSGLVYYVYTKQLGKKLPRTASAQRLATVRIAKASIRPGDLVFFTSYGRVYHVGVYAGSNKVWHSPRPGQRVQLSTIWTRAWVAGRVR
ncbi:C40 family peptidase [Humibacillus xanthopallidus]|uniref:C40 family peptidase n=1 Tax=Humibacillus xanthopallidus TaxID=412689 RepID=UPI00384BB648